jgi:3-isopropylmalate/(R)-2-methylmalate dehydratase large subunit
MSAVIAFRSGTSLSQRRSARYVARAAVADPPMTMTEAIIARRAGQRSVSPGDNVWVDVDKLMTHDVCGPGTFGVFEREFGENAQVRRFLC